MNKDLASGEVEEWPIENIIPYEKNAKLHDPKDIAKLTESIKRFGFRGYVRVDKDGVLIGGHKRRLAAMAAGKKFLPVIVDRHLNDEEVKAARLAENRVHGDKYDEVLMKEEIVELMSLDFDMTGMGFDDREIEFFSDDLSEMNLDSLINDLDTEVTKQSERLEKKVDEVEGAEVSIGEAMGFKKVTIDQARLIGKFIGRLEDKYKLSKADAFIKFVSKLS